MMEKVKGMLVSDVRLYGRKWSTWLKVAGGTLTGLAVFAPDVIKTVWDNFPADLKATLPTEWTVRISFALFVLSVIAGVIKQKSLTALRAQKEKDDAQSES